MATSARAKQARELHDWTIQTIGLLRQLINVLSNTIDAWDMFNRIDIGYFWDNGTSQNLSPSSLRSLRSLLAIDKAFGELRHAQKTLEHTRKVCKDLAGVVSFKLPTAIALPSCWELLLTCVARTSFICRK